MSSDTVLIDRPSDGVALVTLNRPDRMNALSPSTAPALADSLRAIAADESIRAVVITGAGRGFCTGMDLSATDEMAEREIGPTIEWMRSVHAPSIAIENLPQPVIAAVNGPAVGAGFGMALGCDIRIAGPHALFRATFVKMAMGPDGGLSHSLAKIVGHAKAMELFLTAAPVKAEQALTLGLVSAIEDDCVNAALDLATQIAAVPGHTSRRIKATMAEAGRATMMATLTDIETLAQAEMICHPDFFANAAAWLAAPGATR